MYWRLDDDQRMLVEAARAYARGGLIEKDRLWDATETPLTEELPVLAQMGFMNLRLSEEYGGLACPTVVYAHILHELAFASPSVAVTLSVHNMVGEVLQQYGSERLRREILPTWGRSDSLGTFAISEPDAGSDPGSARTRAVRDRDHYVLDGSKMWISNGINGRWFMTLARTGEGKNGLSCFWVDGNDPGLERIPIKGKTGLRGSDTVSLHLSGVRVPAYRLLGQEGEGLAIGLTALNGGRIGIASQATGIIAACLSEMISYSKERRQFGESICNFQAIQFMISDSAVELEASRALTLHAARLRDAGEPFLHAAAKAKLYASEAANRTAYRAVQVHGGSGYVNDCRVERLSRDARVTTIYEGTSEIQRLLIGRGLKEEAQ